MAIAAFTHNFKKKKKKVENYFSCFYGEEILWRDGLCFLA